MKKRVASSYFLKILLIGIALFLVVRCSKYYHSTWNDLFSTIMYPLLLVQKPFVEHVKQYFFYFDTCKELENRLSECKKYNQELYNKLAEVHAIQSYYNDIKELVDFKKRYNSKNIIISQVLLKYFGEDGHFFLIDNGKNRNITPDMIVVYKNFLVGRVTEVYAYYSKVILITDKNCKVSIICSETGSKGISEGDNSLDHFKIAYVNHLERLSKDDLVISSGQGLIFPYGFLLGKIEDFSIKNLQYHVRVKPLLNFKEIDYCTILQKGAEFLPELEELKS